MALVDSGDNPLQISLVVPTYNERPNIGPMVAEVFATISKAPDIDLEIIVVDDNSPDGTASVVDNLKTHFPVSLIKRAGKFGLGSAIMTGFAASKRPLLGVMDADLSHDPSVLPTLIYGLRTHDLSIASRFGPQSQVERWTPGRKWISLAGSFLARQLTQAEDPLSGYFCLRRSVLAPMNASLVSPGYKILLEILQRGSVASHQCYSYTFRQRIYSKSKLNYQEYLLYLKQLWVFGIKDKLAKSIRGTTTAASSLIVDLDNANKFTESPGITNHSRAIENVD